MTTKKKPEVLKAKELLPHIISRLNEGACEALLEHLQDNNDLDQFKVGEIDEGSDNDEAIVYRVNGKLFFVEQFDGTPVPVVEQTKKVYKTAK